MASKERKEIDELIEDAIIKALTRIGLSFVALIVLIIFGGAVKEYGSLQVIVLVILHVVSLLLIGTAFNPKNINKALVGLSLGLLWNIVIIIYVLHLYSEATYMDDLEQLAKWTVGTGFLSYWFIASISKLSDLKKQKQVESELLKS